jgi:hypothetical protein
MGPRRTRTLPLAAMALSGRPVSSSASMLMGPAFFSDTAGALVPGVASGAALCAAALCAISQPATQPQARWAARASSVGGNTAEECVGVDAKPVGGLAGPAR